MRFAKSCGHRPKRSDDSLGPIGKLTEAVHVALARKGLIGLYRLNGFKDDSAGLRQAFIVVFLGAKLERKARGR